MRLTAVTPAAAASIRGSASAAMTMQTKGQPPATTAVMLRVMLLQVKRAAARQDLLDADASCRLQAGQRGHRECASANEASATAPQAEDPNCSRAQLTATATALSISDSNNASRIRSRAATAVRFGRGSPFDAAQAAGASTEDAEAAAQNHAEQRDGQHLQRRLRRHREEHQLGLQPGGTGGHHRAGRACQRSGWLRACTCPIAAMVAVLDTSPDSSPDSASPPAAPPGRSAMWPTACNASSNSIRPSSEGAFMRCQPGQWLLRHQRQYDQASAPQQAVVQLLLAQYFGREPMQPVRAPAAPSSRPPGEPQRRRDAQRADQIGHQRGDLRRQPAVPASGAQVGDEVASAVMASAPTGTRPGTSSACASAPPTAASVKVRTPPAPGAAPGPCAAPLQADQQPAAERRGQAEELSRTPKAWPRSSIKVRRSLAVLRHANAQAELVLDAAARASVAAGSPCTT